MAKGLGIFETANGRDCMPMQIPVADSELREYWRSLGFGDLLDLHAQGELRFMATLEPLIHRFIRHGATLKGPVWH